MATCAGELTTMDTCVQGDEACNTCFDPATFKETWPTTAYNWFRSTMAFKAPDDPEFCIEANWRFCRQLLPSRNGSASCCCLLESKKYFECMFSSGWMEEYDIVDTACEYQGCELFDSGDEGGGEGGSSQTIVIGGGAGGAVLIGVLVLWLYWRRRRLQKADSLDDDDEEKGKKKKKDKKGKDKDKDEKKKKKDDENNKGNKDDTDSDDSDDSVVSHFYYPGAT